MMLLIISPRISTSDNFILHGYLFVQVIKGLDQGILGGEGVPPMHEGMILRGENRKSKRKEFC